MIKLISKVVAVCPAEPKMLSVHCTNCPSAMGDDLESDEIKTWPHSERVKLRFSVLGMERGTAGGYCDKMEISNEDLHTITDN